MTNLLSIRYRSKRLILSPPFLVLVMSCHTFKFTDSHMVLPSSTLIPPLPAVRADNKGGPTHVDNSYPSYISPFSTIMSCLS
ncbi:hypothetical protein BGW37DRAFT_507063 [Umbelopsis sp. PMI_123]|nr:hypothetical protein BGW37DRAFT_507063 [Umbelopsis sp. PMI_123]